LTLLIILKRIPTLPHFEGFLNNDWVPLQAKDPGKSNSAESVAGIDDQTKEKFMPFA
jgi:hypothetical protein